MGHYHGLMKDTKVYMHNVEIFQHFGDDGGVMTDGEGIVDGSLRPVETEGLNLRRAMLGVRWLYFKTVIFFRSEVYRRNDPGFLSSSRNSPNTAKNSDAKEASAQGATVPLVSILSSKPQTAFSKPSTIQSLFSHGGRR